MSKEINRREAFAATMGMAVAPLAIASASPEPVPELTLQDLKKFQCDELSNPAPPFLPPEINFVGGEDLGGVKLSKTVVEPLQWNENWHEHGGSPINRAIWCLHRAGGLSLIDAEQVMYHLKHTSKNNLLNPIVKLVIATWKGRFAVRCIDSDNYNSLNLFAIHRQQCLDAIYITARTGQDGFEILEIKEWWREDNE